MFMVRHSHLGHLHRLQIPDLGQGEPGFGDEFGPAGSLGLAPSAARQPFEQKLETLGHPRAPLWITLGTLPRTQTGAPTCFILMLRSGTFASLNSIVSVFFCPAFRSSYGAVCCLCGCSSRQLSGTRTQSTFPPRSTFHTVPWARYLISPVFVIAGLTSGHPVATQGQYITHFNSVSYQTTNLPRIYPGWSIHGLCWTPKLVCRFPEILSAPSVSIRSGPTTVVL